MIERVRTWMRRYLAAGSFGRAVATMATGSGAAMALTYLAQPILARLYAPAAFGTLDVFVSVVTLLMPLATLRYDPAILLPEKDDEAANVAALTLTFACAATALLGGVAFLLQSRVSLWGYEAPTDWLLLAPVALLVILVDKIARYWLTRKKLFSMLSFGQVARAGVTQGGRIAAGIFLAAGAGGLIGGYLAGLCTAALFYLITIWRKDNRSLLRQGFRFSAMQQMARRYRRFPIFTMPSVLLSTLATRLPFLLLLLYFDETIVGQYGRASLLLAAPLSLLGHPVGEVFFAHGAEAARDGALRPLAHRVHARLAEACLFPTLALMLAGPDVFTVVLGETWRAAGYYLRFIAPWIMLSSIMSPMTVLFDVLERQRMDLIMSAVLLGLQTTALVAGGLTGNLRITLLALGIAGVIGRLIHGATLLSISRVPLRLGLRPYARAAQTSLPFLLPVAIAVWLGGPITSTVVTLLSGLGFAWHILPKLETSQERE